MSAIYKCWDKYIDLSRIVSVYIPEPDADGYREYFIAIWFQLLERQVTISLTELGHFETGKPTPDYAAFTKAGEDLLTAWASYKEAHPQD